MKSPAGPAAAFVLYAALNALFFAAPNVRVDVTEESLFTLSQGTHTALAAVDEPVTLHFFFSGELERAAPPYSFFGGRIRDLLGEIAALSAGKVTLREYDPKAFSVEEDQAAAFGIQGVPLDQSSGLVYFGLAAADARGGVETIPFFQLERETFLEYDIIKLIRDISNTKPRVLGFMGSLPVFGDMRGQMEGGVLVPWAVAEPLRKMFKVLNLPQSVEVLPSGIDVIMAAHPAELTRRTLYELEQFLFRGGRLLLFADPRAESDLNVGPNAVSSSVEALGPLFDAWGVRVPAGKLVADQTLALRVNAGTADRPVPSDYPAWLGVTGEYMSQEDPVTGNLRTLVLPTPGFIVRDPDSPLTLEPIIMSSRNSGVINADETLGLRPDAAGLSRRFKSDAETYVIAARLHGEVNSAFPDGPPPKITGETPEQGASERPHLARSQGPINVILAADADLLQDRFWIREQEFFGRKVKEETAGNGNFVINALGALADDDALLELRSRGAALRPFDRVLALQKSADEKFKDKENRLQQKLAETKSRIETLKGVRITDAGRAAESAVEVSLSSEERAEIETMRRDMLEIRNDLRAVQRRLREDVDLLETRLQIFNIGFAPAAVCAAALITAALRARRRRRYYAAEHTVEQVS